MCTVDGLKTRTMDARVMESRDGQQSDFSKDLCCLDQAVKSSNQHFHFRVSSQRLSLIINMFNYFYSTLLVISRCAGDASRRALSPKGDEKTSVARSALVTDCATAAQRLSMAPRVSLESARDEDCV